MKIPRNVVYIVAAFSPVAVLWVFLEMDITIHRFSHSLIQELRSVEQPEPTTWTKGKFVHGLWCEVSSSTPDAHWCDYAEQRAKAELKSYCADREDAIQCRGR